MELYFIRQPSGQSQNNAHCNDPNYKENPFVGQTPYLNSPSLRAMMNLEVRDESHAKSLLWNASHQARMVVGWVGSRVRSRVHHLRHGVHTHIKRRTMATNDLAQLRHPDNAVRTRRGDRWVDCGDPPA